MGREGYRAGAGYRRLPRTFLITILACILPLETASLLMEWRARRTDCIRLVARFDVLARRYAERRLSDLEAAQLAAEDVSNIEDMARVAVSDGDKGQVTSLKKMATDKEREAERFRSQARKWKEVETYYASMRQQYEQAARHPWWMPPSPSGDPLDVESVFMTDLFP